MRRLVAMQESIAERPPLDHFVRLYFMGREWWHPPARAARQETELPESDLPEFEP